MTKLYTNQNSSKPQPLSTHPTTPNPASHSKIEDMLAMIVGTFIVSLGLMFMQSAHILTGGTAGLALLLHYTTGVKFSILFFLVNLPFYYLGYKKLGVAMVVKTMIAVGLLSVMTEIHPMFFHIQSLTPLYATILASVLMGIGLLILFRHRASLGGFNLLALFIQEHYQIAAGKVQMALDACVLIASCLYVPIPLVMISLVGGVILNVILTMNHRKDRYVGY